MLPPNIRRAVTSPRQGGRRRVVQRTPIRDSHQPDGVGSPPPQTQHAPTPRGNKTLRANITIASLNINGGGTAQTKEKWQHINQLLRDKKIGILAVQETHLGEDTVHNLHSQFPQHLQIINSSVPEHPNAMGVAVILNKSYVAWNDTVMHVLIPGRAMLVSVPWHKKSIINVLAVYAPNRENENATFWDTLKQKWAANEFLSPDVLLGDFNCVEADMDRLPLLQLLHWRTSSLRLGFLMGGGRKIQLRWPTPGLIMEVKGQDWIEYTSAEQS